MKQTNIKLILTSFYLIVLVIFPNYLNAQKATKLFESGQPEKAAKYCSKQKGDKQKGCYTELAELYFKKGDYESASIYYEKSDIPQLGFKKLAEYYYTKSNYKKASELYEKAQMKREGNIKIAEYFMTEKDYVKASCYYERAGEIKSGNIKIGDIYFEREKFDTASYYYEKAKYTMEGNRKIADKFFLENNYKVATKFYLRAGLKNEGYNKIADKFLQQKEYYKAHNFYTKIGKGDEMAKKIAEISVNENEYDKATYFYSYLNDYKELINLNEKIIKKYLTDDEEYNDALIIGYKEKVELYKAVIETSHSFKEDLLVDFNSLFTEKGLDAKNIITVKYFDEYNEYIIVTKKNDIYEIYINNTEGKLTYNPEIYDYSENDYVIVIKDDGKYYVVTRNTKSQPFESVGDIEIMDKKFIYTAFNNRIENTYDYEKAYFVINNEEYFEYEDIESFKAYTTLYHYKYKKNGKWHFFFNGNHSKAFDRIGEYKISSNPDIFAFEGDIGDKYYIMKSDEVIFEKEKSMYPDHHWFYFNPLNLELFYYHEKKFYSESNRNPKYESSGNYINTHHIGGYAYQINDKGYNRMNVNGSLGPSMNYMKDGVYFSENGKNHAYVAKVDEIGEYNPNFESIDLYQLFVNAEKKGKKYRKIDNFVFSPDNRKYAYSVYEKVPHLNWIRTKAIVNGISNDYYYEISNLKYNSTGEHYLYAAKDVNKKWYLIYDGKVQKKHNEEISEIKFCPNNIDYIYVAGKKVLFKESETVSWFSEITDIVVNDDSKAFIFKGVFSKIIDFGGRYYETIKDEFLVFNNSKYSNYDKIFHYGWNNQAQRFEAYVLHKNALYLVSIKGE